MHIHIHMIASQNKRVKEYMNIGATMVRPSIMQPSIMQPSIMQPSASVLGVLAFYDAALSTASPLSNRPWNMFYGYRTQLNVMQRKNKPGGGSRTLRYLREGLLRISIDY